MVIFKPNMIFFNSKNAHKNTSNTSFIDCKADLLRYNGRYGNPCDNSGGRLPAGQACQQKKGEGLNENNCQQ
jgi:hypothetical protein